MKLLLLLLILAGPAFGQRYENYRPQIHFSPQEKWMNDPNGMVYYEGEYHLFFQYHPAGLTWGPMHWGHAVSPDLMHWQELPIALYPDSAGMIFSGSVVVDAGNTSGFGQGGKAPLVAIYTRHDAAQEKAGRADYQNQCLAYSLDKGRTWTKYDGNPVLRSPNIKDFRDPKVSWHAPTKRWLMALAVQDHIEFYASPDLKAWSKESEFGQGLGAHGGVWECPDLFPLQAGGQEHWVLLVSINPGGPQGGSATQYFVGSFDGHTFTPDDTATRWIDRGADDYAGVTFSNTGSHRLFMGWMSNWLYADKVPTSPWRGAMTLPRELGLKQVGKSYYLTSEPVAELGKLAGSSYPLTGKDAHLPEAYRLDFTASAESGFEIRFQNSIGQALNVGFENLRFQGSSKQIHAFYIDRSASNHIKFDPRFPARHTAARIATGRQIPVTIVVDKASIELFADGGLTTMTDIFFPGTALLPIRVQDSRTHKVLPMRVTPLHSIWRK